MDARDASAVAVAARRETQPVRNRRTTSRGAAEERGSAAVELLLITPVIACMLACLLGLLATLGEQGLAQNASATAARFLAANPEALACEDGDAVADALRECYPQLEAAEIRVVFSDDGEFCDLGRTATVTATSGSGSCSTVVALGSGDEEP